MIPYTIAYSIVILQFNMVSTVHCPGGCSMHGGLLWSSMFWYGMVVVVVFVPVGVNLSEAL